MELGRSPKGVEMGCSLQQKNSKFVFKVGQIKTRRIGTESISASVWDSAFFKMGLSENVRGKFIPMD